MRKQTLSLECVHNTEYRRIRAEKERFHRQHGSLVVSNFRERWTFSHWDPDSAGRPSTEPEWFHAHTSEGPVSDEDEFIDEELIETLLEMGFLHDGRKRRKLERQRAQEKDNLARRKLERQRRSRERQATWRARHPELNRQRVRECTQRWKARARQKVGSTVHGGE